MCRVAAVRQVGAYRELLVHQGEERDLCIRLRAAGWGIQLADVPPIVHSVSPNRDRRRMHRYAVRNQILFDAFYAPALVLPAIMARHSYALLTYRPMSAATTLRYLCEGLRDAWQYRRLRSAVPTAVYRSHMGLPAHGPRYVAREEFPAPAAILPSVPQRESCSS